MKIKNYTQFKEKLESIERFWKILPTSEIHFNAALKKIEVPDIYQKSLLSELRKKNISYDYPWYRGNTIFLNNRPVSKIPEYLNKQFVEEWTTPDNGIFIINDTTNGYVRWECLTKDELSKFINRNGMYDYKGYIHLSKEELEKIDTEEKLIKYNI